MNGERIRFETTQKAISLIKQDELRMDLDHLLKGVGYALERDDFELGNIVIDRLAAIAHALSRTIGGEAATRIIDGLGQDVDTVGEAALRGPGWDRGRRCDTSGSRSCVAAQRSTCHGDPTGCISTGDGFSDITAGYVWGVVLL